MTLFPHNQIAYQSVLRMLEDCGKACVIHPTGTGKSFIGFQLAADFPFSRVIWLAPSEYIFRTQMENWLSACASADAIQASNRTESGSWRVVGGRELTNITFLTYAKLSLMTEQEIEQLFNIDSKPNEMDSSRKGRAAERLSFPDASGKRMDAELVRTPPRENTENCSPVSGVSGATTTIVLDEFHRAGAEHWGGGVDRLIRTCPNARLLGLTATNIRYLDAQRDMAQELFDGHIASEMSLGEAIVRGILPAPKYVLSIFKYKDDLAKYELRARHARNKATRDAAEEILEKLRRALENAVGLDVIFEKHMEDRAGKYLVFCANAEHMREMMAFVPEWFAKVDPHPHVYSAYSEDPETDRAFADFKADTSDHLKLLFCIDMLNEGIHVPDVSGVILLRPTVSPIVYKQQIGRALSASHKTISHSTFNISNSNPCPSGTPSIEHLTLTQGTVFCVPRENTENCSPVSVPVIFDIVMNIENLYSISSVQEEIEVAVTYYHSLGQEEKIEAEGFTIIDEVHDCLELFDRLNETLTTSWDIMFDVARAYHDEFGDLDVPLRYVTQDGYSLGHWIAVQRKVRAGKMAGKLTPERIRKLDSIGMRWESRTDKQWERYYAAAKQYHDEHGDLLVPWRYATPDGVQLASWISNLRLNRKSGIRNGYLTPERIAALDQLGMCWDVLDYLFEQNYAAAVEYHRTHGNLDVPAAYVNPDGVKLGAWLRRLCRIRAGKSERGRLTEDQIARLDALGMIWGNRNDLAWERGFAYAEAYAAEHHTLNISPSYKTPDGYKLGGWVSDQREKYRAGKMKPERKARLDAIGMPW